MDIASDNQNINMFIYDAYGLKEHNIYDGESWYARRYPHLVAPQKENMRKLGKSDDYLELYGEFETKTEI